MFSSYNLYIPTALVSALFCSSIEIHRGPAAYVLGPLPSRGRDLELEGGVNACHVEYSTYTYTSPETPTCEEPSNGVIEIS